MNYYLYKLRFDGAVHLGASDSSMSLSSALDHFCADTLFSALCHTANALWGSRGIEEICSQVRSGALRLSDSMPWRENEREDIYYYIPKPCAVSEARQELPAQLRKAMKRLNWLPVNDMEAFGASLRGEKLYMPDAAVFGMTEQRTCAAVQDGQDTRPYQVGAYHFFPNCGLYFLSACASESVHERLCCLLNALGISGLGGKVSAGYGKFRLEDVLYLNEPFDFQTHWLYHALTEKNPKHYLLLTSALPQDSELERALDGAQYQLIRRGGFVQSDTFSVSPLKKQTQYFLSAGAMLKQLFSGALYQVGQGGSHPVYRYAVPMMLGVSF